MCPRTQDGSEEHWLTAPGGNPRLLSLEWLGRIDDLLVDAYSLLREA